MNDKLLTPIQLWENYNPIKETFDITYTKQYIKDNIKIRECFFKVKTTKCGSVRAYMALAIPLDAKGVQKQNCPAVVFVDDIFEGTKIENAIKYAKMGYVGVVVDYAGQANNSLRHTFYPTELDYCNAVKKDERIIYAPNSTYEVTWYIWAQVIRRAVSVLTKQSCVNKEKIALIGVGYSTNIAWQVGAMDGRISQIVAINGAGWTAFSGKHSSVDIDIDAVSSDKARWLVGIASQNYAQFIHCPLLLVMPTNSAVSNFDKVGETLGLISPKIEVNRINLIRRRRQITKAVDDSINIWLGSTFENKKYAANPTIKSRIENGKLLLELSCDTTNMRVKEIVFYYAYGEENSSMRQWYKKAAFQKEEGVYVCDEITPLFNNEEIYAFATVEYIDGRLSSTNQVITKLPTLKDYKKERLIISGLTDSSGFVNETKPLVAEQADVIEKEGALGISGISVVSGDLVSYLFADKRFIGSDDKILQFDACAKSGTKIELVLAMDVENVEKFYKITEIVNSDKWERLSFKPSDFKDGEHIALKTWEGIKKIIFKDAENYIINNMLWI